MNNDELEQRCRVWANEHTLGNIGRKGVGATKELAASVYAFVQEQVNTYAQERDALASKLEAVRKALSIYSCTCIDCRCPVEGHSPRCAEYCAVCRIGDVLLLEEREIVSSEEEERVVKALIRALALPVHFDRPGHAPGEELL